MLPSSSKRCTVLAVCAIYAFVRPILWLQIYKQIGVLSIILQELSKDIMLFSFILCLVMAAFCSAMVGIMPSLGESSFDTDGAFALPWWALFGEFGELHNVGVAGGWLGPMLLWTFSFLTQARGRAVRRASPPSRPAGPTPFSFRACVRSYWSTCSSR